MPLSGSRIKRRWLRYYDELPERGPGGKIIQSWDTAGKAGAQNDWSVCTTWHVDRGTDYYLVDLVRDRFDYPTLKATALGLAAKYEPDTILIEDASTGIALAQELDDALSCYVELVPVSRDKEARVFVQQGKFAAGQVLFPKDAPFLPDLESELLSFPHAPHDDQVDSVIQMLGYVFSGYTLDYL